MYRKQARQVSFILPFGGEPNPNNRWVQIADLLPWVEIEEKYAKNFRSRRGHPAKSARMAIGALIVKEMPGLSDEGTVEAIAETPAMQYLLGFEKFVQEEPFDPSSMVHFGKRFGADFIEEINRTIIEAGRRQDDKRRNGSDDDFDSPSSTRQSTTLPPDTAEDPDTRIKRKGKPIVDATCSPADIHYPTDLGLLNTAREKSEEIVDVLFEHCPEKTKKPRTYRKKARKRYPALAKKKKPSTKLIRKGCGQQLRYLKRNPKHIEKPNEKVSPNVSNRRHYKNLLAIHELYRRQQTMYETKTHSIPSRIVNISRPHVRPIVRGKASAQTEFGAKLSASVCEDGFATLDRLSWEAYSESGDLEDQIEKYRSRTGYCPRSVLADRIYRTRDNRQWCKSRGIGLSGPRLGRPPISEQIKREEKLRNRQDERERNAIEGKFGQGKRRFGLSRIMAKLQETSETAIAVSFLVMNLVKLMELFLLFFFWGVRIAQTNKNKMSETGSKNNFTRRSIKNFLITQNALICFAES